MAKRLLVAGCVAGALVVLVACAGRGGVSIAIAPSEVTLAPGESQVFTATVMGAANKGVVWSSSGPTVDGLVPSGMTAVFTAPAVLGEYTVTARSAADQGRWASAVVTVEVDGELPSPPSFSYSGDEPVLGEADAHGRVSIESEVLGVRFVVQVSDDEGGVGGGALVWYEELGEVLAFFALDPSTGGSGLVLGTLDSLRPSVAGDGVMPSAAIVFGVGVVITKYVIPAVAGGIAGGAFSWRLNKAHTAGREVQVLASYLPAASVADGVVELCVSPLELMEFVQARALQEQWLGRAYSGAAMSFVLAFVSAALPPVGELIGPTAQRSFEFGATALDVGAVSLDIGHLAMEGPRPLAEEIHRAALSAYPELGSFGFEETLRVTLIDYRESPLSMGDGGVSWSAAVVSGVGCDRSGFGSPVGSARFVTELDGLSRGADALITVEVDPPVAGLRVFLGEEAVFEYALDEYRVHRRLVGLTDAAGRVTFRLTPPASSRDIPLLRSSRLTLTVPERFVVTEESATWTGVLGVVSPDAFNLALNGREAAVGQVTEFRYFTTNGSRAVVCEVDWDDGWGWREFDCPRNRWPGASAPVTARLKHAYSLPGVYAVRVRVTGADGQSSGTVALMSVSEPRTRPARVVSAAALASPSGAGALTASTTWLVEDVSPDDAVSCSFADGSEVVWSAFPCSLAGSAEFTIGEGASELFFVLGDGQHVVERVVSLDASAGSLDMEVNNVGGSAAVGVAVRLSGSGGTFSAVSDAGGVARFAGVPPGEYTGEVWLEHDEVGQHPLRDEFWGSVTVTVVAGDPTSASFTRFMPYMIGDLSFPSSLAVDTSLTVSRQIVNLLATTVRPRLLVDRADCAPAGCSTTGVTGSSTTGSTVSVSVTPTGTGTYGMYLFLESFVDGVWRVTDQIDGFSSSFTVTGSGGDFDPAPSYITISNVDLGAASGGTRRVSFDISWDESWRGPDRPTWVAASNNWDAAWVFVKYRVSGGAWQHATLAGSGHAQPSGSVVSVPGDRMGAFVYRSSSGYGTFAANGVGLQWDYLADGVAAGASVDVQPFGIEMVYVPQGSFSLGSGGSSTGEFRAGGTTNTPFVVSSQSSIALGNAAGQLMWTADLYTGSPSGNTTASFPTGYGAFYVMKYQVTQGQYVDFLNSLTQAQADARKFTGSSYRYAITGSGVGSYATSLPYLAMNNISWADGAAYADWAGLRPMSELEFEKAARGPLAPVADEYAWGSTSITQATGLADAGTITETPTPVGANANYSGGLGGPVRVGSFAAPGRSRRDAGAGYYGALELSGNLWERPVTVGNAEGRAFSGAHGDGTLDGSGNTNVSSWPGSTAVGSGFRGACWIYDDYLRVSDRNFAASGLLAPRSHNYGWRGARSAP